MKASLYARAACHASLAGALLLASSGCGDSSPSKGKAGSGGNGGGGGDPGGGAPGSGGRPGSGGSQSNGGEPGLPIGKGEPDPSVQTALPSRPAMTNVRAAIIDDNVAIKFDPVEGARDYRVYVLPDDSDVSSTSDGRVTVRNALYRCAGDRQAPPVTMDSTPQVPEGAVKTLVDGVDVLGYTRREAEATLGHVYVTPGPGRVPVYALANPAAHADNDCLAMRWTASRDKRYVVSTQERDRLLSERWRDDGIVFYVPEEAGATTRPVYTLVGEHPGYQFEARLYLTDGPEADSRSGEEVAFHVLAEEGGSDTQPLMRVFYENSCGWSHDELVPGAGWFQRVRQQGDQIPLFDLRWTGITAETVLVVEALADGCPYQGFHAPVSREGFTNAMGEFPQWLTPDELRAASPTGEVYINGQHDVSTSPRPIARSFLRVSPGPTPEMDWFEGFRTPDALGTLSEPAECTEPGGGCYQTFRGVSDALDTMFHIVETEHHGMASMLGELWVAYGDELADSNGKFRFSPNVKATMAEETFLHATMTVDAFSTGRRYPQIMISDQESPVQWNMNNGNTLIVQTRTNWPNTYELQVCDHVFWDVNQQCPQFEMYRLYDADDPTEVVALAPTPEVGEHTGMDRATRFDVYTSTRRAYLFLDGQPYGCADLPEAGVPSGPVTVTFGDVLYHSDADELFTYTERRMYRESRRHFDNLGFRSGASAPAWDHDRFPCVSRLIPPE